jgi:YD repeat-containing protein
MHTTFRRRGFVASRLFPFASAAAAAVILVQLGGPAGAQMGHVHQWAAYEPPGGDIVVTHMNGSQVSSSSPAQPCEVVRAEVFVPHDRDQCTAPGCNYQQSIVLDLMAEAIDWKNGDDDGQPGHFVKAWSNGHWRNDEYVGEDGNLWSGPGNIKYYRVPRQPGEFSPRDGTEINDIVLQANVDDSGTTGAPGSPAFDDDPAWIEGAFPVEGGKCYVPRGRGVTAKDCSVCSNSSAQPGNSSITPIDGDVSFTVPVTSWAYRGEEVDFSLTYHSRSAQDPRLDFNRIRHPAGLSDREDRWDYNPKWTHNFAQWLEVLEDGTAIWNRGDGTQLGFAISWNGNTPSWKSGESYHTLSASGQLESPQLEVDDEWTSVETRYAAFVLKDGDGTAYTFDRVRWNLSSTPDNFNHFAIPYFLLTRIEDRWGRNLTLSWDDTKGVTSVTDGAGRSLTFQYNGDKVLTGVTDPYGRSHTFGHTNYDAGSGAIQPRLTTIDVQGPGGTTQHWQFGYGGAFKDLVTSKAEPSGRVVYYEYEAVNTQRLNASDWDGRLTRTYYVDDLVLPYVTREITRNGNSLTYPGGDTYTFGYDGQRLSSITHVPTNASVHYGWDQHGNLTSFRTGIDQTSLVTLAYTYRATDDPHILSVTATDAAGHHVTTAFNDLNLPTQTTAFGVSNPSDSRQPDAGHLRLRHCVPGLRDSCVHEQRHALTPDGGHRFAPPHLLCDVPPDRRHQPGTGSA